MYASYNKEHTKSKHGVLFKESYIIIISWKVCSRCSTKSKQYTFGGNLLAWPLFKFKVNWREHYNHMSEDKQTEKDKDMQSDLLQHSFQWSSHLQCHRELHDVVHSPQSNWLEPNLPVVKLIFCKLLKR